MVATAYAAPGPAQCPRRREPSAVDPSGARRADVQSQEGRARSAGSTAISGRKRSRNASILLGAFVRRGDRSWEPGVGAGSARHRSSPRSQSKATVMRVTGAGERLGATVYSPSELGRAPAQWRSGGSLGKTCDAQRMPSKHIVDGASDTHMMLVLPGNVKGLAATTAEWRGGIRARFAPGRGPATGPQGGR